MSCSKIDLSNSRGCRNADFVVNGQRYSKHTAHFIVNIARIDGFFPTIVGKSNFTPQVLIEAYLNVRIAEINPLLYFAEFRVFRDIAIAVFLFVSMCSNEKLLRSSVSIGRTLNAMLYTVGPTRSAPSVRCNIECGGEWSSPCLGIMEFGWGFWKCMEYLRFLSGGR